MISSLVTLAPAQTGNLLAFLEILQAAKDPDVLATTLRDLRDKHDAIEKAAVELTQRAKEIEAERLRALEEAQAAAAQKEQADRSRADCLAEQGRLAEARQQLEDERGLVFAERSALSADEAAHNARVRAHQVRVEEDLREIGVQRVTVQAERQDIDRRAAELDAREADLQARLDQLRNIAGA